MLVGPILKELPKLNIHINFVPLYPRLFDFIVISYRIIDINKCVWFTDIDKWIIDIDNSFIDIGK